MSLYEKSKAKDIIHNKERLSKIVGETLDKMATVVGATLGPGGRAVLLEREGQPPLATKDGVTVAKSLGLDNAEDNIIIEAAKEICINTAKDAGDGTTTAIVLANAITKYGQEFVKSNAKYNPQRIVNELEDVYEDVIVPYIKSQSQDVSDEEKLVNVATISANGDRKIAKVVVEAIMAAGDDGKVLIEEAQGDEMRVETIEGYIITSGLKDIGQLGPMFMNDRGGQQCKMDDMSSYIMVLLTMLRY
jgi:chaperonin GroEL